MKTNLWTDEYAKRSEWLNEMEKRRGEVTTEVEYKWVKYTGSDPRKRSAALGR